MFCLLCLTELFDVLLMGMAVCRFKGQLNQHGQDVPKEKCNWSKNCTIKNHIQLCLFFLKESTVLHSIRDLVYTSLLLTDKLRVDSVSIVYWSTLREELQLELV